MQLAPPQPARHPDPTTKASALAYAIFDRPDLKKAEEYLIDFGLRPVSNDGQTLFLRGTGPDALLLCRPQGGEAALRRPRARGRNRSPTSKRCRSCPAPPRSRPLTLAGRRPARAPDRSVRLSRRRDFRAGEGAGTAAPAADAAELDRLRAARINGTQRPPFTPPDVIRLGHVALELADYQATSAWYTQHFGFIPSDVQALPDGSPAVAFMRLDRGDTADRPSYARARADLRAGLNHVSFELVDPDAVGIGNRLHARPRLEARLGHGPASARQPDLRLLGGPLGRQARALLRRRPLHRGPADRRPSGEQRRHGAMGPGRCRRASPGRSRRFANVEGAHPRPEDTARTST